MSTPNDPNPVDMQLRDKLSDLRRKFFDALISIADAKDEKGNPVTPSAAELTVIRGVLRDNSMVIDGEGGDAMRKALEDAQKAGLPEFDDDPDEDDVD